MQKNKSIVYNFIVYYAEKNKIIVQFSATSVLLENCEVSQKGKGRAGAIEQC